VGAVETDSPVKFGWPVNAVPAVSTSACGVTVPEEASTENLTVTEVELTQAPDGITPDTVGAVNCTLTGPVTGPGVPVPAADAAPPVADRHNDAATSMAGRTYL